MPDRDTITQFLAMSADADVTQEQLNDWYAALPQEQKDEVDAFIQEQMERQSALMNGL